MAHADGFLGMRGTGDWVTNERPENWRQGILKLYPNGKAPLTAILSMMGSEKTDDPTFHWWTQELGSVSGAISGIYTDSSLTVAYTSGAIAGATLYVAAATTLENLIRVGHQVLLRYSGSIGVDVNAKVTALADATVGSPATACLKITVKLLEADDNSSLYDLSDADTLLVVGNINEEGAAMPEAISLNPTEHYNYTQIFRDSLYLTRTARKTRLRTDDAYARAQAECLEMHSIGMELSTIWGIRSLSTGAGGKPERTQQGIVNFIKSSAPNNVKDYRTDADFAGTTWLNGGDEWMDNFIEQIFRYGAEDKLGLCGSGALLGITRLIKEKTNVAYEMNSKVMAYGIKVTELTSQFGTIYLKTHPLFSYDATTRNMILLIEPKEIRTRFIDDTTFFGEKGKTVGEGNNYNRIDGTKEEYLTEAGLEFHWPIKCGIMNGVGLDNNLSS